MYENQCTLRTCANYEEQCSMIKEDPHCGWSLELTVHACILNQLKYFHSLGPLLPDVMHNVLEGVLPYEMKIMLQRFIRDHQHKIIAR